VTKRVFLHVGLPKSGTTYVQAVMARNKDRLREQGLLFPGADWQQQVLAIRDLREMTVPSARPSKVAGSWAELTREVSEWSGDAAISMEWLCAADEHHIRRAVADLAPATVHVVFTVRDLGRTIPAAWQEFAQNRQDWTWQEFLDGVVADDPMAARPGRAFWAQQDVEALTRRWATVVSPKRVQVVTVPHPGAPPDLLWRRLCTVFGIEAAGHVTEGLGGNASLGYESAELMRRVNWVVRDRGMPPGTYERVFKHGLAKKGLAQRKKLESTLVVPAGHRDWLTRRAAQQVQALEAMDVQIVGTLDDLSPVFGNGTTTDGGDLDLERVLDAAVEGLVAMGEQRLAAVGRARSKTVRLQRQLSEARKRVGWRAYAIPAGSASVRRLRSGVARRLRQRFGTEQRGGRGPVRLLMARLRGNRDTSRT